jgi:hypothetical protein
LKFSTLNLKGGFEMDFLTLADTFKSLSGRSDFDSATICGYLNAGQKFLDDSTDFSQQPAHYIYTGTVGQSFLSLVAQARSILSVSLVLGKERFPVIRLPVTEMQALEVTLPSYKDQGLPLYYSMANLRKIAGKIPVDLAGQLNVVETGTVSDKLGMLFNCPFDQTYTIDIVGKFYSPEIADGEDPDTFWAINYPFTLLHAGMYKLEVGYRNSEGMKDWLMAINADLRLIDFNDAEQSSVGINQMRG